MCKFQFGNEQTLTEQWNGASWSVVPSPNVSGANLLFGVTAVSESSVWAVGQFINSSTTLRQTLTEQWNGSSWSVVPSPNVGSSDNSLSGVVRVPGSSNVWAVGDFVNSSGNDRTLIEQWNGTSWKVVPSPNIGSHDNSLSGVTAVSASDIWVVGTFVNSSSVDQTLTEQWNSTSWKVVPSPNVGSKDNSLAGVARVPGSSSVWAVGTFSNSSSIDQTLTEFFC